MLFENLAEPTAQPLHPQGFIVVAAQIFLEGDILE
jgi:hypothetical protein